MTVALPSVPYTKGNPRLVRSNSQAKVGTRLIANVEWADPVWIAEMETDLLDPSRANQVRAFIDEVGSGARTVLYKPSFLPIPYAYWSDPDAAALVNTGAVTSITDGFTVAMDSVTDGLTLTRGDLVGLEDGDYRSMHRVMIGGAASGGILSIVVEPFVPGYIGVGAVVRFLQPELNMRMLVNSDRFNEQNYNTSFSFTLVEVPK